MAWQFTAQQPIYQQIVDELELRIFNGTYPLGERMPSVRDLAMVASVNPNTMQRALSELESRGLISTQRTSGRMVTTDQEAISKAKSSKAEQLCATFMEQMRALGMNREETRNILDRLNSEEENDGSNT